MRASIVIRIIVLVVSLVVGAWLLWDSYDATVAAVLVIGGWGNLTPIVYLLGAIGSLMWLNQLDTLITTIEEASVTATALETADNFAEFGDSVTEAIGKLEHTTEVLTRALEQHGGPREEFEQWQANQTSAGSEP